MIVIMRKPDNSPKTVRGKMFTFIVEYKLKHDGCAPSYMEIVDSLYIGSRSTVKYHLVMLERIGMIKPLDGRSRTLEIVGGYVDAKENYPEYFEGTDNEKNT